MNESPHAVRELRLALVCYGGLSLCIYMHGITKEIQKLVIASRAFERDDKTNPFGRTDSAHAYWELLRRIRAGELGDAARQRGVTLRVVVDVISGTSAGGINGVYLAKALAGNHAQDALRDLWLDKGDIKRLLRGWRRLHPAPRLIGLVLSALARPSQKKALLRGDEMCAWLHEALETMSGTTALPRETTLLPPGHDLALFVPVTDFHGYARDIPMHDPPLARDRTHRHVMTFRHRGSDDSHFGPRFHHLLAFGARATSSFPGMFEPISFAGYQRALPHSQFDDTQLGTFFPHYAAADASPRDTQFIDGGLLNNYPFGEAVAAIEAKSAVTEVDRRLIYIEPDPGEHGQPSGGDRPTLWRTALAAIATIPAHEPIAEDLLRVNRRNDAVLRIRDVIEANFDNVSEEVETLLRDELIVASEELSQETLLALRKRTEDRLLETGGLGQRAYLRLRVRASLDRWAHDLSDILQLPPAAHHRDTVGRVLRRWAVRERLLDQIEGQTAIAAQRQFLAGLDVGYHERKLHFLIAAIRWWYGKVDDPAFPGRDELDDAKRRLYAQLASLSEVTAKLAQDPQVVDAAHATFPREQIPRTRGHDDPVLDDLVTRHRDQLNALYERATSVVASLLASSELALHTALTEIMSGWRPEVRNALMTRYLGFPFWDAAIYPLQTVGDVGELDHVQVCRFSPLDATLLAPADIDVRDRWQRGKLAGAARHHFGAFFTRPGRERDYLWGRLDAAERLVTLLLDAHPGSTSLAAGERPADSAVSRNHLARACAPVFEAILADERGQLGNISTHIDQLGVKVAELHHDDAAARRLTEKERGMQDEDTGTIGDVPEAERLDVDQGEGSNALEGGDDSEAADRAFQAPGDVKILGGAR